MRSLILIEQLQKNETLNNNAANLPFENLNGTLYAKSDEVHHDKRPVIPKTLETEIFTLAHDQLGHLGWI